MRNEQTPRVDKFLPGFGPKKPEPYRPSYPETPPHTPPQSSEQRKDQKPFPKSSEGKRLAELLDDFTITVNFGNRDKWGEAHYPSPQYIDGIYDLTDDETGPALIELVSDKNHLYFTDAVDGLQTLFRIEQPLSTLSIEDLKKNSPKLTNLLQ